MKITMQTEKGQSIEDASMKMIEDEIGLHNVMYGNFRFRG